MIWFKIEQFMYTLATLCWLLTLLEVQSRSAAEEARHVVFQDVQCAVHVFEHTDDRVLELDDVLGALQRPSATRNQAVGVLAAKVSDRPAEG